MSCLLSAHFFGSGVSPFSNVIMLSVPKGLRIFPHLFFPLWTKMKYDGETSLLSTHLPLTNKCIHFLVLAGPSCSFAEHPIDFFNLWHNTHTPPKIFFFFFQASHRLCCKWFPLIAFFWGVEGGCELISPPTCGLLQELCCSSMAAPVDLTLNYSVERLHWVRCCQEARLILLTTSKLEAKSTTRVRRNPTVIQYVAAY